MANENYWHVTVEIPKTASFEQVDKIFDAVADAAEESTPADADWDVFIYNTGPKPSA